ncbi:hypothetical protein B0H12DRAFT_1236287 [Mycena haematopus]|nr:hypothetical protein B0H12DRAFT_1236287 [Mycena haematopus]
MSSTGKAQATVTRTTGKLPTMHRGEVNPIACSDFQDACRNYFAHKGTAAASQVGVILGCFEDTKINNWLRPDATRTRLLALTFTEFMIEFRKKFLRADWVESTRRQVLSSRQKEEESFDDWSTTIISLVALLNNDATNASITLDDKRVRHTLEAGMLPELNHRYSKDADAPSIKDDDLDDWIRAIIVIDEARMYKNTLLNEKIAALDKVREKGKRKTAPPNDETDDRNNKKPFVRPNKPVSSEGSSTSTGSKFCPPLTVAERELLAKNDGCNKCRKFFVGHISATCPNDYPDPTTYRTLVQADVDDANKKKDKGKSKAVAAVMPAIEDDDDSVNSENDEVSTRSSHRSHHLFWKCLLEGPMSNLPIRVQALIDNGAFLVLIDEELVDMLMLRCFKLYKPEPISLALTNSDSGDPPSLTEYVKLKILSADQTWSSTPVRALVARNLCSPIILGLPWLEKNSIVIDHEARTAVDKRVNYDLLNPPAPKAPPREIVKLKEKLKKTKTDHKALAQELKQVCEIRKRSLEERNLFEPVKPVDVVAAVRERIEVLAHWEELERRGQALCDEL